MPLLRLSYRARYTSLLKTVSSVAGLTLESLQQSQPERNFT